MEENKNQEQIDIDNDKINDLDEEEIKLVTCTPMLNKR